MKSLERKMLDVINRITESKLTPTEVEEAFGQGFVNDIFKLKQEVKERVTQIVSEGETMWLTSYYNIDATDENQKKYEGLATINACKDIGHKMLNEGCITETIYHEGTKNESHVFTAKVIKEFRHLKK